ncbi:RHS repeat-associated protein [Povalibacter uvarum]|uniref:RHS repeat-associated protein n=1 Tax=Povalibacter uvarum TaxID=732238 RepID=A0A841HP51_9GAMM|nr:DUF2235 domain-containing protein [Povalibacter uvarum]MBB6094030.1 RHS repeat-associated protein [Povalibacter uvarum]
MRQRGAAIVEAVIALPILLAIILGAIQFGLIYQAKATLNFAGLQAARAGAVNNARPEAIRGGLARGLAPLYSPDSSVEGVARTIARINAALVTDARIRILNPTREAFADFGEDVEGVREIPNDRLHSRSTTLGALSGVNIQDANLLRVEVMYGYELQVPLVNAFIARFLLSTGERRAAFDAFQQQLLRRGRLPIVTTATVRMQSPARMSDAVVSRGELPDPPRIRADARPPDDGGGERNAGEQQQGEESAREDGSSLSDGFLGFGIGSGDGSGGGASPGGGGDGSGGGGGGSSGGGGNSGNPAQCPADGGSPSPPGPTSSGASLPGVGLPSLSVGDSIHVVTGNKYHEETDLPAADGALGLMFARHYNSDASRRVGVMGAGWRHTYEASIVPGADGSSLDLWQADGRRLRFVRATDSSQYLPQRGGEGEVHIDASGYRWLWPSGRQVVFDTRGRLTALRQGADHVVMKYDDAGQLDRMRDSTGRDLRIDYYPNGRVARVVLGGEIAWHYAYDRVGNLAQVVSPDGRSRRYEYTDVRHPNHLTAITAGASRPAEYGGRGRFLEIARWEYDERGRAIMSTHPGGAEEVTLVYDKSFTDVADAFGKVTRHSVTSRDGIAWVTEVRGPSCTPCDTSDVRYEFNRRYQVTSMLPKAGPSFRLHYDDRHRLVGVEQNPGDADQKQTRYEYEGDALTPSRIRFPSVNAEGSHEITYAYRSDGQIDSIRETGYSPTSASAFSSIERTVRFAYDAAGRLVAIDGPRTDVADVIRIGYDGLGRRTLIRTPEGNEQRIDGFSAMGQARSIHNTGLPTVSIEHDSGGRAIAVTELRASGKRTIRYAYDVLGRLTGVTDEHGRTRTFGYDAAGRPDRIGADDMDASIRLRYAADGKVAGAALLSRGAPIRNHRYVYDDRRRLTEIRDGQGPPLRQLEYDGEDTSPARLIDPLGEVTELTYDASHSPDSLTAPDGGVTRFQRDTQRRLVGVTDPNDARSRYRYDDFGRRVLEETADGGAVWSAYDEAHNIVERRRANGERTRYEYDADNRLIAVKSREGVTRLTYRGPHLIAIDGYRGSERFKRDRDGQLTGHARIIGGRVFHDGRRFDGSGRLIERAMPSGLRLKYSYNEKGGLSAITLDRLLGDTPIVSQSGQGAGAQSRAVAAMHPMGRFVYGNGIELHNLHDLRTGKLASRETRGVSSAQYRYDQAGQTVAIATNDGERRYEYDTVGRLKSAKLPAGDFSYRYDANGNRLSTAALLRVDRTESNAWKLRSQPADGRAPTAGKPLERELRYSAGSNRLREVKQEHTSSAYSYDAMGNPIRAGSRNYEYNSEGRPYQLFVGNRLVATYAYNLAGERISKTLHGGSGPGTTFYIYERHQLIAEADSQGRIAREYVYLGRHPVALIERGRIFWIHTDHLGTPIAMTDADRRVVWKADYEPFGKAHVLEDPDGDGALVSLNLRFPGQYADAESGTHYNLTRDYDPSTGRYLTVDPLGLYDGTNPYAYVHGSPISNTDPLGLYLFAFDGTWVNRTNGTLTNVELFRRYYDPTMDERNSFYRRGIGTPAEGDTDWRDSVDRILGGATGLGGREIIDDALNLLDRLIRGGVQNVQFDGVIDIVGFSRGAAIGRAFANEIYSRMDGGHYRHALSRDGSCRSLRIRFMGLFDTVAAFGIPTNDTNIGYDLTIDDRVGTVAHAIALNEHRAAFDLISIQYSEHAANTSQYRQERAFIGAHSDIGGGYANGDLSDLALRWMHTQAIVAGVRMTPLLDEHLAVSAPLLHDERRYPAQDREIFYPNDPLWERETCPLPVIACAVWEPSPTQRQATAPQFQFPELRDMIRESRQSDAVRGVVDMERYRAWLRSRGQL